LLEALARAYPEVTSALPPDDHELQGDFPDVGRLFHEHGFNPVTSVHGLDLPVNSPSENALLWLLKMAIEHFGFVPRDAYAAVFDFRTVKKLHEDAFGVGFEKLENIIATLTDQNYAEKSSHRIICIHPAKEDDVGRSQLKWKSRWVAMRIAERLQETEDTVIRQKISYFRELPQTRGLAGLYFEIFAHRSFVRSVDGEWPLTDMDSNNVEPPTFTENPSSPITVCFPQVRRKLHKFFQLPTEFESGKYYQPRSPTFPLFDAFVVDFDYSCHTAVLWVLQMTMSREHRGSMIGYQNVRAIVSSVKKQLKSWVPTNLSARDQVETKLVVVVRYVLVTAQVESGEKLLTWSFPKGWSKTYVMHNHRGKVYCLGIPLSVRVVVIMKNLRR